MAMTKTDTVRACLARGMDQRQIATKLRITYTDAGKIIGYIRRIEEMRDVRERYQGHRTFDKWKRAT
jgi:hypothetical protein